MSIRYWIVITMFGLVLGIVASEIDQWIFPKPKGLIRCDDGEIVMQRITFENIRKSEIELRDFMQRLCNERA